MASARELGQIDTEKAFEKLIASLPRPGCGPQRLAQPHPQRVGELEDLSHPPGLREGSLDRSPSAYDAAAFERPQ